MNMWLGQLGSLLHLDDSGRYSCRFTNAGRRLLLTGIGTETQTGHNNSVARNGLQREFFYRYR